MIILLSLMTLSAHAEFKVGLVDMQKAIFMTGDGQRAKSQLEIEFNRRQAILQKMEKDMRERAEAFDRKSALLAKEARDRQQMTLQNEMLKFRETAAKSQNEMEQLQQKLFRPIAQKLNLIAERLAKENSFDLVLNRVDQVVIFAAKQTDLTDQVVKEYERPAKG